MIYDDYLDDPALLSLTQAMNQRAKQNRAHGQVTIAEVRDCIYGSGGRCAWCGVSLLKRAFEIDHIIALSRGGQHTPDNLAVACPTCNRRKASKHVARFAQEIYAETGDLTPLLERIFQHFEIDARTQARLFAEHDTEQAPPHVQDDAVQPPDDPDTPPYIWKS